MKVESYTNQVKPRANQSGGSAQESDHTVARIRSARSVDQIQGWPRIRSGGGKNQIKGRHQSDQHEARMRSSRKPDRSIVNGYMVDLGILIVQVQDLEFGWPVSGL